MNTTDYPKINRILVIFDDMVNYYKQQDKIANHFSDGRHQNISTCYMVIKFQDSHIFKIFLDGLPQKVKKRDVR